MAKKKARKPSPNDAPKPAKKPAVVATRLSDLLPQKLEQKPTPPSAASTIKEPLPPPAAPKAGAKPASLAPAQPTASRARPRSPHTTSELAALNDAYRGVRPLPQRIPRTPRTPDAPRTKGEAGAASSAARAGPARSVEDEHALERLGALVGEGQRFELRLDDDGYLEARKLDAPRKLLSELRSPSFRPDATLDLHGLRAEAAARAIDHFVRDRHRRGARRLLVITGKGQHAEDGVGVLREVARRVLTSGGAAPFVSALCSAHAALGGRGALAVCLRR